MQLTSLLFVLVATGSLVACESPPKMHAPTMVRMGEDVLVTFDAPLDNRPSSMYWIALQSADTPTSSTVGRIVLERGDRKIILHAPTPGDAEVRLHDGYPKMDHHLVARAPVAILYGADSKAKGPAID